MGCGASSAMAEGAARRGTNPSNDAPRSWASSPVAPTSPPPLESKSSQLSIHDGEGAGAAFFAAWHDEDDDDGEADELMLSINSKAQLKRKIGQLRAIAEELSTTEEGLIAAAPRTPSQTSLASSVSGRSTASDALEAEPGGWMAKRGPPGGAADGGAPPPAAKAKPGKQQKPGSQARLAPPSAMPALAGPATSATDGGRLNATSALGSTFSATTSWKQVQVYAQLLNLYHRTGDAAGLRTVHERLGMVAAGPAGGGPPGITGATVVPPPRAAGGGSSRASPPRGAALGQGQGSGASLLSVGGLNGGTNAQTVGMRTLGFSRNMSEQDAEDEFKSMSLLARSFELTGRLREGEAIRKDIVRARRNMPDASRLIHSMSRLASNLFRQARYDEAAKLMGEVVELLQDRIAIAARNKERKREHTLRLRLHTARSNQATALSYTNAGPGKHQQVARMRESVLKGRLKQLGEDHPDTLAAMHNLAASLDKMGNLAVSYHDLDRLEDAMTLEKEVDRRMVRVFGRNHQHTLSNRANMASTAMKARDYTLAANLLSQVLEDRKQVLGPRHRVTLNTMDQLADTLFIIGDVPAALQLKAELASTIRGGASGSKVSAASKAAEKARLKEAKVMAKAKAKEAKAKAKIERKESKRRNKRRHRHDGAGGGGLEDIDEEDEADEAGWEGGDDDEGGGGGRLEQPSPTTSEV